jgi:hypothetical protein
MTDLGGIRDRKQWPKLRVVGMCFRERTIDGVTTAEASYFIGSWALGARRYGAALRNHGGIETQLPGQLAGSFREDDSREEHPHGATSLAVMRKLALGLLKQHPRTDSIARKRRTAARNTDFRGEVLAGASKLDQI